MLKKLVMIAGVAFAVSTASAAAQNVVETAQDAGVFGTLLAAAQAAGLADALAETKNITVFAPTDDAFAKLPEGTVENLLKPENRDQLVAVLTYHVLPRELASNMLPGGSIPVKTLNTSSSLLRVEKSGGGVMVDQANVVSADIKADNGIIHVIDSVLLPNTNKH